MTLTDRQSVMTTSPETDAAGAQTGRRGRSRVWVSVPFLVWLWLCFPLLAGWEMIGFRDAPNWYQPAWEWVDGQPWRWDTAPWNPWDGAGAPVAADPTIALFYPPRWLMRLPVGTHVWRFSVFLALHVLMACATAGLFARRLGCNPAGSAVAAMAYGLGGTVLFQVTNPIYLVGAAWLPLALVGVWDVSRVAATGREWTRGFLLSSVALAMMVLGGDVQLAYLSLLIAAVTCWTGWWKGSNKRRKPKSFLQTKKTTANEPEAVVLATSVPLTPTPRPPPKAAGGEGQEVSLLVRTRLLWTPVAMGLAVGLLSLAQVWPSAEFARFSARYSDPRPQTVYDVAGLLFREGWSGAATGATHLITDPVEGTHAEQVYQFSQPPWTLAELFLPGFSGYPWPVNTRWLDGLPGADRMWNVSLYPGALVMLLAGLAVFRRREPQDKWMFWIGLFGLLGALGWFGLGWMIREVLAGTGRNNALEWLGRPVGGVYWLLVTFVPGMSGFRYPAKLFVFVALAIAMLGGRGTSWLKRPDALSLFRWSSIVLGLIWLVLAISDVQGTVVEAARRASPADGELTPFLGPVDWSGATAGIGSAARWAGTALLISGLLTFVRWKNPGSGSMTAIGLLLAIELAVWQSGLLPRIGSSALRPATIDSRPADELMWRSGYRLIGTESVSNPPGESGTISAWLRHLGLAPWLGSNIAIDAPRHHWRSRIARLDGPLSLQPDRARLPQIATVRFGFNFERVSVSGQAGEVQWWTPTEWTSPAIRAKVAGEGHRTFAPRALFTAKADQQWLSPEYAERSAPSGKPEVAKTITPGVPCLRDSEQEGNSLLVHQCLPGLIRLELRADSHGVLYFPEAWPGGWDYQIVNGNNLVQDAVEFKEWHTVSQSSETIPVAVGNTVIQLLYRPLSWRAGNSLCAAAWLAFGLVAGRTFRPASRNPPVVG